MVPPPGAYGSPAAGNECCKSYKPIWELAGYSSAWRCANGVVSDAWYPLGGEGTQIIVGIGGLATRSGAVGLFIGGAMQWLTALSVCSEDICVEYGEKDECGNCE